MKVTISPSFLVSVPRAILLGLVVSGMGVAGAAEEAASGKSGVADVAKEVFSEELCDREEVVEEPVAVSRAVNPDPVQVFGWREWVFVGPDKGQKFLGKLDSGAYLSSIHAENQEVFERDGQKWVRFELTWTEGDKKQKLQLEAPLVRVTQIKRSGVPLEQRNVVKLVYRIGSRRMRGEFTLNDRDNMTAPILIGRADLKILGWVDSERSFLADQKIFR